MISDRPEHAQEIEMLFNVHERLTQSSECRYFNRRIVLLLQNLEDVGLF
jgi:hypothetical protein